MTSLAEGAPQAGEFNQRAEIIYRILDIVYPFSDDMTRDERDLQDLHKMSYVNESYFAGMTIEQLQAELERTQERFPPPENTPH